MDPFSLPSKDPYHLVDKLLKKRYLDLGTSHSIEDTITCDHRLLLPTRQATKEMTHVSMQDIFSPNDKKG